MIPLKLAIVKTKIIIYAKLYAWALNSKVFSNNSNNFNSLSKFNNYNNSNKYNYTYNKNRIFNSKKASSITKY